MTEAGNSAERRSRQRYPIRMPLFCRVLHKGFTTTLGETINMSSSGLLFSTNEPVPAHATLELYIEWPAASRDGGLLKLEVFAKTVRSEGNLVAAEMRSHRLVEVATEGDFEPLSLSRRE
jgi:PilZ domain-containing protein